MEQPFTFGAEPALTVPKPGQERPQTLASADSGDTTFETATEAQSALAVAIGEVAIKKLPIPYTLNNKQMRHIELYSRQLTVNREQVTGQAIWNLWPDGFGRGRVSASITDPAERVRVARAGQRPMIGDIQGYLESTEYSEQMKVLGIEVNTRATGLTTEQMGLITHFTNFTDGKNIRQKLKDLGISWSKYQAWRSQPVFSRYYEQLMGDSINDALPFAKQQIAAKMGSGDLNAIKFGMELTGEYDPRGQNQIDARALLALVLEIIEEEIKDSEVLSNIATKLQLRSKTIQ